MNSFFIIWIATIIFGIAYFRMRDKIPTYKRDKFESVMMIIIIILLLINIAFQILETKNTAEEINDCILFYRYYPNEIRDLEFNFIQDCHDQLSPEKIENYKKSGRAYSIKSWEVNQNE